MILLDTCTLIWLNDSPEKLSRVAVKLIREHTAALYVSAITAFEIGIKASRGKLWFKMAPGAG